MVPRVKTDRRVGCILGCGFHQMSSLRTVSSSASHRPMVETRGKIGVQSDRGGVREQAFRRRTLAQTTSAPEAVTTTEFQHRMFVCSVSRGCYKAGSCRLTATPQAQQTNHAAADRLYRPPRPLRYGVSSRFEQHTRRTAGMLCALRRFVRQYVSTSHRRLHGY